jgi:hypothetical protein
VPFSLPVIHIVQFALLAAVLLVVGIEDSETQQTMLGQEDLEAQQFENAEIIEPISCVPPVQHVSDMPLDPFQQNLSSCQPSLKKSKKKKGKTVVIMDTDRRRSSRINKLTEGYMSPDPNLGIGKPRGKVLKGSSFWLNRVVLFLLFILYPLSFLRLMIIVILKILLLNALFSCCRI